MIELKNVSFYYAQGQKETGLQNINLHISKGEVILLCGESGCGKTTLTRLINGLIPHYYEGTLTGEVQIGKKAVHKMPLYETANLVGSVFQNPRTQFFNVDTTSELAFGCENSGLPEEEISSRIAETVSDFKLDPLMGRSIFQLSGGEKQKIACASVSACHPDIYVLDEPSSNLDMRATNDLRKMIALWKSQGKTIVIAEHRLYYLRELADRIIYMKNGKIDRVFDKDMLQKLHLSDLKKLGLRALCLESVENDSCSQPTDTQIICLKNFLFSYGSRQAVNVECLHVPKGSIIAVIGHNGAGKSTFARCLCGLQKSCKGRMETGGKKYNRKDRLKHCYMVMQDVNHQLFAESVLDEVLLSMEEEDTSKAEQILSRLDLLHLKEMHPMSLSGGQKQRVAIASAIASEREIIIFDEPTSGLDLRHMHEVSENLEVLRKMGKTLFLISHDLELILKCCSHVIHFEEGRVIGSYPLDISGSERLKHFFTEN